MEHYSILDNGNISDNPIDEKGLCHLLSALNIQAEIANQSQDEGQSSATCKGLLRLQVNVNDFFLLMHCYLNEESFQCLRIFTG